MSYDPSPSGLDLRRRFTDRESALASFGRLVRSPRPVPVLAFFGIAGFGKTYLLRYLQAEHGYRWNTAPLGHPHALVSFEAGATSVDPAEALWSMRDRLRELWDFRFDRFDLVWAMLWERTSGLSIRDNRAVGPADSPVTFDLLDAVPGLDRVSKILRAVRSTGSRWRRRRKRKVVSDWMRQELPDAGDLSRASLRALDTTRLLELLPRAFAADLASDPRAEADRVLLFFDAVERLAPTLYRRSGRRQASFVESLCASLIEYEANVLAVVASRNLLRWGHLQRSDGSWIADPESLWTQEAADSGSDRYVSAHLEQYLLGDFSSVDSVEHLVSRRGLDHELAEGLFDVVGGYPLALDAAADLVTIASSSATQDIRDLRTLVSDAEPMSERWRDELSSWLLARLFQRLEEGGRRDLIALFRASAILRWFDRDLLAHVADVDFLDEQQYSDVVDYSFVRPADLGEVQRSDRYALHPRIRELIRRTVEGTPEARRWHEAAVEFFQRGSERQRAAGEDAFESLVETAYHTSMLDTDRGLITFLSLLAVSLDRYDIGRANALIAALNDGIGWTRDEWRLVKLMEARILIDVAAYDAAFATLSSIESAQPSDLDQSAVDFAINRYIAECLRLMGQLTPALERWDLLVTIADLRRHRGMQFLARWGRSLTLKLLDRTPEALEECLAAQEALGFLGPNDALPFASLSLETAPAKRLSLLQHRAELQRYSCDFRGAMEAAEPLLQQLRDERDSHRSAYTRLLLGHVLRMEGRFVEALSAGREARSIFDGLGDRRASLSAARLVGQADCSSHGRLRHRAAIAFQELVDAGTMPYPYGPLYGHLGLGEIARLGGRHEDALRHYEHARRMCESLGGRAESAYALLGVAEVYRARGDSAEAAKRARFGLELGTACGMPWIEAHAAFVVAAAEHDTAMLTTALEYLTRYSRREGDQRLEDRLAARLRAELEERREIAPIPLNFL